MTLSVGLIEQVAALLAYILHNIKKKKNKIIQSWILGMTQSALLRARLWLSTSPSPLWLGFILQCSKLKTKLQAIDTTNNTMKEKNFCGPKLFLPFLHCGNNNNKVVLKLVRPTS